MNEVELYQFLSNQTNIHVKDLRKVIQQETYYRYHIKQGSKYRQIEEPCEALARIQKALLPILDHYPLVPACIGGRKGFNTKVNGDVHGGAKHLLKVDISHCFQSIKSWHINNALRSHSELNEIANAIVRIGTISCLEGRFLPTGAPTSPVLCNISLTPLDLEISVLASREGYLYTRYLDDIALSTTNSERQWSLIDSVFNILKAYGLQPNKRKSRWMKLGRDKMEITGINLAHRTGVPRELRRDLRVRLHHLAIEKKELDMETKGLLSYIHSIDPESYQDFLTYWQERCTRYENPK